MPYLTLGASIELFGENIQRNIKTALYVHVGCSAVWFVIYLFNVQKIYGPQCFKISNEYVSIN